MLQSYFLIYMMLKFLIIKLLQNNLYWLIDMKYGKVHWISGNISPAIVYFANLYLSSEISSEISK